MLAFCRVTGGGTGAAVLTACSLEEKGLLLAEGAGFAAGYQTFCALLALGQTTTSLCSVSQPCRVSSRFLVKRMLNVDTQVVGGGGGDGQSSIIMIVQGHATGLGIGLLHSVVARVTIRSVSSESNRSVSSKHATRCEDTFQEKLWTSRSAT